MHVCTKQHFLPIPFRSLVVIGDRGRNGDLRLQCDRVLQSKLQSLSISIVLPLFFLFPSLPLPLPLPPSSLSTAFTATPRADRIKVYPFCLALRGMIRFVTGLEMHSLFLSMCLLHAVYSRFDGLTHLTAADRHCGME